MAKTTGGKSLKERLQKKRQELSERGSKGNVIFVKEGTLRVRILPVGPDKDFIKEVTHFYLGADLKSVYSPSTFDQPCALMEAYQELKKSKDEDDKDTAKKLVPKKAYFAAVVVYNDDKGKTINEEDSGKLIKITGGVYQDIIDLYLDEDEAGDMTDPSKGYDIKIKRTGKGQFDTEYSVMPCKPTKLDKKWAKPVDLDKLVKAEISSYEETEEKLEAFLGISNDSDDEDDKPKKKKKKAELEKAPAKKKKKTTKEEAPVKKKKKVKK
jgi:hypothetical protein